ncbi:MAG TPA: hypothetical protein VFS76_18760 [Pyrinomonadaceae bacterium]|nr:hypothetical protein [Pyrinomonadaceae bacterium]
MRQVLIVMLSICFSASTALAQSWTFSSDRVEYVIEFPSRTWRTVSRVDVHEHPEFVYGSDELNGYLRLSKILVNPGTSAGDLFQSEEKLSLEHLPGYVICGGCKGESFGGKLSGATFSYEYADAGKVMAGRLYYLQVDMRTFYALRFTVARDKLPALREQMKVIARSFRLK